VSGRLELGDESRDVCSEGGGSIAELGVKGFEDGDIRLGRLSEEK
jgi:hypothetical protein